MNTPLPIDYRLPENASIRCSLEEGFICLRNSTGWLLWFYPVEALNEIGTELPLTRILDELSPITRE